jgi:glutamine synthetase
MTKVFLEYIWLDGHEPQQLRSKTKVVKKGIDPKVGDLDVWSFDGSSTKQAKAGEGENTDCVLKPVFVVNDPFRGRPHKLVLCDVYNPDGETPHKTNHRVNLKNFSKEEDESRSFEKQPWFGWEQEYTLTHKPIAPFGKGEGLPLGFNVGSETPREQGEYYCGVGSDNVIGRRIADEHLEKCEEIGLEISGINAEVMIGQWEYQIGPVTAINGSDQLWMSRYILQRVAEKHNVKVSLHPKPIEGDDWNGSGCHVNFSTKDMREDGGLALILEAMESLKENHDEHIKVYGLDNDKRLSGKLETSNMNEFSFGYSTRDTSVRIPLQTEREGKGYFEDRRPSSNCDPYLVSSRMLETVNNTVSVSQ